MVPRDRERRSGYSTWTWPTRNTRPGKIAWDLPKNSRRSRCRSESRRNKRGTAILRNSLPEGGSRRIGSTSRWVWGRATRRRCHRRALNEPPSSSGETNRIGSHNRGGPPQPPATRSVGLEIATAFRARVPSLLGDSWKEKKNKERLNLALTALRR